MIRWGSYLVLTAITVLFMVDVASAAFHLAVIDEIMTSYGGDSNVQFVEIRMLAGGQTFVSNSVLGVFDATGAYTGDALVVPSNLANSGAGLHWLMATPQFTTVSSLTPDFTFPNGSLPSGGGMVCWGAPGTVPPAPGSWDHSNPLNYIDCIAYGTYSGPTNAKIGTPTPLDADGHALQRMSQTANNEVDFSCVDPAMPTTNAPMSADLAATTPCPSCGDNLREGQEECDGADSTACPGECWSNCRCPCATVPETCNQPTISQKGTVLIKTNTNTAKDLIVWKWLTGGTNSGDFGDPLSSTNYALCVYDQSGSTPPTLLLSARAPAAGVCDSQACWKTASSGFKYSNKDLTPDGVLTMMLKEGAAPKSKVIVKAKGANLPLAAFMQLDQPVAVQLRSSDGKCWGASYSAPAIKNQPGLFKDKND